jgi:outer membrane protein assembly factor BamB
LFAGPRYVHAVEVNSGRELWRYEHGEKTHLIADPIVLENELFLSLSESCVMLEMSETGVEEVWSSTELNVILATPVLINKYLYGTHWPVEVFVSSYDWGGMLRVDWPFRCVSWETGEVMWEHSMKSASLTAAGEMLIVLELDGTLRIVEATPSSFTERYRVDVLCGEETKRLFATPPVLLDGKIYCRNHPGELICIDVSE